MESGNFDGVFKAKMPEVVDSSTEAQFREELFGLEVPDGVDEVVLDASDLKYISSAGLRVLLGYVKRSGKKLVIDNVSRNVYDIFYETGFTELMDVKKALRFVDIEGLEFLGRGVSGTVYRLNDEQVVKVFHRSITRKVLERIARNLRAAIVQGVPTMLPFEIVTTKDGFGFILEAMPDSVVAGRMHENPEKIPAYAERMALVLKHLAGIKLKPGELRRYEERLSGDLDGLEVLISPEDIAMTRRFLDAVPESYAVVHGDFQGCNIVEQDSEFILIDMDDFGYGHPAWDVTQLVPVYHICCTKPEQIRVIFDLPPQVPYDAFYQKIFRLTREEAALCFDCFMEKYFEGVPDWQREKCNTLIEICNDILFIRFINLNIAGKTFTPEQIEAKRAVIMEYVNDLKRHDVSELEELFAAWPDCS